MRTTMLGAAVVALGVLAGATARADEGFGWTYEGYKFLDEAAAKAKKEERRLLVGLSGGDT